MDCAFVCVGGSFFTFSGFFYSLRGLFHEIVRILGVENFFLIRGFSVDYMYIYIHFYVVIRLRTDHGWMALGRCWSGYLGSRSRV